MPPRLAFFILHTFCSVMTAQPHPVPNTTLQYHVQAPSPHCCPSQPLKVTAPESKIRPPSPPPAAASGSLRSDSLHNHYPSTRSLLRGTVSDFPHSPLAASASCSPRSESLRIHRSWVAHSSQAATSRSQSPRCHCPGSQQPRNPASHSPRCH